MYRQVKAEIIETYIKENKEESLELHRTLVTNWLNDYSEEVKILGIGEVIIGSNIITTIYYKEHYRKC